MDSVIYEKSLFFIKIKSTHIKNKFKIKKTIKLRNNVLAFFTVTVGKELFVLLVVR